VPLKFSSIWPNRRSKSPGTLTKSRIAIGGVERIEIILIHVLFESAAAPPDPLQQDRGSGLEIDDQIGFQDPLLQDGGQLIVEDQLVIAQIQVCENPILGEQVVGKEDGTEHIMLKEVLLLPIAA